MRPSESTYGAAGGRARTSLTGRAAMLALVVCLLAISLAYPLREYLSQRGDIGDYQARVAEQERRVSELRAAKRRWEDPAYVEAQARERLRYVMPGETSYVVLEAEVVPPPDGVVGGGPETVDRRPWFSDLWHSVEAAGKG
jgi:cell division protein FtsB